MSIELCGKRLSERRASILNDAGRSRAQAACARRRPASFKIEARRSDKRFPHSSLDIARHVGARVQAATGLPVDVHKPALRLGIEVGTDVAYVFAAEHDAPGGLPVGAS